MAAVESLESCVEDVRIWMLRNRLKMNDSKTEMMVFAPPRAKLPVLSVSVGPEVHQPAASVRNLGLAMDTYLSMELHVAKTCQTGYFQLRSIRSVQRVLPPDALEKLVHAFITARLDYCNSVLIGISNKALDKLQLLQNSAARVVTRTQKYDHITSVFKALHWIEYKVLILAYKAMHGLSPGYIADMLSKYTPTQSQAQDSRPEVFPLCRTGSLEQPTRSSSVLHFVVKI